MWRAFEGGSVFAHVIWFVKRSEYKTLPNGLQDLRRGKRYPAGKVGKNLENTVWIRSPGSPREGQEGVRRPCGGPSLAALPLVGFLGGLDFRFTEL